jgi:hypothetical protein
MKLAFVHHFFGRISQIAVGQKIKSFFESIISHKSSTPLAIDHPTKFLTTTATATAVRIKQRRKLLQVVTN